MLTLAAKVRLCGMTHISRPPELFLKIQSQIFGLYASIYGTCFVSIFRLQETSRVWSIYLWVSFKTPTNYQNYCQWTGIRISSWHELSTTCHSWVLSPDRIVGNCFYHIRRLFYLFINSFMWFGQQKSIHTYIHTLCPIKNDIFKHLVLTCANLHNST